MNPSGKIWKADPFQRILRAAPSAAQDCVFLWTPWHGKYAWTRSGQLAATTYTSDALGKNVLDPRDKLIRNFPTNIMPITGAQEPARTNIAPQSAAFGTTWLTTNATLVENSAASPDGTVTADSIYPTTTGTVRAVYNNALTYTAASWTTSVFAKNNGMRWLKIWDHTGAFGAGWFDLTNGVVGTAGAGYTLTMAAIGSGWYRCSVTGTGPAGTGTAAFGPVDADNSDTATTSGTNGILLWGAQVELGAFPSSYIPTTTTSVTRAADALRWTNSTLFDPLKTAGTLLWAGRTPHAEAAISADQVLLALNNGDGVVDRVDFYSDVSANVLNGRETSGSTDFADIAGSTLGAYAANDKIAMALAWANNDVRFFLNGTKEGADTGVTVPANLDRLEIGGGIAADTRAGWENWFAGCFDRALTDDECKALTHSSLLAQYEYAQ